MSAVLPAARIEEIRVAWERDLEREFAENPLVGRSRPDHGEKDPRIPVDEVIASRLYRVAADAAARLGVDEPYEILLSPKEKRMVSAQALRGRSPFAIRLIGPVASLLDDAALAALIGHELGHHLALGPLAEPPSLIIEADARGASTRTIKLADVACELTADRFALLACRDLHATVRLEVAVSLLDSPTALGLREAEFLERSRRRVENDDLAGARCDGYGIPCELRLYATWLFWRSPLYQELSGDGPGDLDLHEADRRLRELVERQVDRASSGQVGATVLDANASAGFVGREGEIAERPGSWTASLAAGIPRRFESSPSRSEPKSRLEAKAASRGDPDAAAWREIQDELAELDPTERRFRELERADEEARRRE